MSTKINQKRPEFTLEFKQDTAKVFDEFLQRLVVGIEKKVFVIVDGHPVHRAKLVNTFIEANRDKLELFFLPPYSPELNPDELVWDHVKTPSCSYTLS